MSVEFFRAPDLLTKKEAGSILGIRPSTVAAWLRKGHLERAIHGNQWYITLRSVRRAGMGNTLWEARGPYYEGNRVVVDAWIRKAAERFAAATKRELSAEEEKNGN